MPIHDWTRVSAGTFHDFHCGWIAELRKALNKGLLPAGYYAMAEQVAGNIEPDVLTLESTLPPDADASDVPEGAVAVATAPPQVRTVQRAEEEVYVRKRKTLAIRHKSKDRLVALVEIVFAGNKAGREALEAFVEKTVSALRQGIHVLVIDLHPPGPRDRQGIHGAIWAEISQEPYRRPKNKPLTLVSYAAGVPKTAYIQPMAVGEVLPDMPLFLTPEVYVPVPLETTYRETWEAGRGPWKNVLEALS
jgi:hypothetical protein